MSMPGKTGATLRATRAIWRRSPIRASPAPGYWTLTATSRSVPSEPGAWSRQRPRCTCPIDAAAVEPHQPLLPVVAEVRGELLADRLRRHRRSRVLQRGQVLAVGRGDLLRQRGLQDAQGLAELHRPALELAERAEELLGRALLHVGQHGVGGLAPEAPAQAHGLASGVAQRQRRQACRAGGGLARELGHGLIVPCRTIR